MKILYFVRNKLIILLTIFFSPILFLLSKFRKRNFGDAPRILVIPQLTRIGDLVCATPVFRAIKEKFPQSFLAVMVTGKIAQLIKNNPHINEVIQYSTKDLLKIIKAIRAKNFDWSFALTPAPLVSAISILGFIPRRAKIIRESKPLGEFLTDFMSTDKFLYKDGDYLPGEYLKMQKFIGIENTNIKKELFVTEEGEKKAEEFISRVASRDDFVIGFSITAGNKIKEWGDHRFAKLMKLICEKYQNAKLILIGSKNDETRIEKFIEGLPIYKATHFSIEELPSLIKRLDLYIGVDTGPIYIAEAMGTPLVDIIGPVDPREQPPCEAPKSICVLPAGDIKPSSFVLKHSGRSEEHKRALENTSAESVMKAIINY